MRWPEQDGEKQRSNTTGLRPPWKPGESGNPGGRPKGTGSITSYLRRLLKEKKGDKEIAELLAQKAVQLAGKGEFRFLKEILERTDGKVPDKHEVTGGGGAPVAIAAMSEEQLRAMVEAGRTEGEDGQGNAGDEGGA